MIRLRYLLVAVLLLGLVTWVLDGLSLSCAILAVDCVKESSATVRDENAGRSADPRGTPRHDGVASTQHGSHDASVRALVVQDPPGATARDAAAPNADNEFS